MAINKIKSGSIEDDAITSAKVSDGVISAADVADGTLTNAKLAGSIANDKLANSSITVNGTSVSLGGSADVGTQWQTEITADGSTQTTAVAGRGYFINVTSNAHTVNLPAGNAGDEVHIVDSRGNSNSNNISLTSNGSEKINGINTTFKIDKDQAGVRLVYTGSTHGWVVSTASNDGTSAITRPTTSVDYLVIAGGGQGHYYGGGGAGGYRTTTGTSGGSSSAESSLTLNDGDSYTVTVGAGGTDNSRTGNNSVFATITSLGGGTAGQTGGSGGGANNHNSSGAAGTSGQGNAGGAGYNGGGSNYAGGGGGGAGQGGGDASSNQAGVGGNGLANNITGSSVTRGGGGGGGTYSANHTNNAPGGSGGGGNGGKWIPSNTPEAGDGTVNTGGGGGGDERAANQSGGHGGSGIVIIKYSNTKTVTVGSGLTSSTTTSGDYKITSFTAGTDTISIA